MRRTLVFRLMWKIEASERPSNVENRPRVRIEVQTAPTHICEYVWQHPTNYHPPVTVRDIKTVLWGCVSVTEASPNAGRDLDPKSYRFDRANISTHELISPHSCAFGHQMMFP